MFWKHLIKAALSVTERSPPACLTSSSLLRWADIRLTSWPVLILSKTRLDSFSVWKVQRVRGQFKQEGRWIWWRESWWHMAVLCQQVAMLHHSLLGSFLGIWECVHSDLINRSKKRGDKCSYQLGCLVLYQEVVTGVFDVIREGPHGATMKQVLLSTCTKNILQRKKSNTTLFKMPALKINAKTQFFVMVNMCICRVQRLSTCEKWFGFHTAESQIHKILGSPYLLVYETEQGDADLHAQVVQTKDGRLQQ